jgi:hypothetical protein
LALGIKIKGKVIKEEEGIRKDIFLRKAEKDKKEKRKRKYKISLPVESYPVKLDMK